VDRGRVEQCQVGRHLRGRVGGAVEVVDQEPARVRGHPSTPNREGRAQPSTRLRYPAASSRPSSSPGSLISTTKIHPAPYGSALSCSGVSSRLVFTSTMVPLTGA